MKSVISHTTSFTTIQQSLFWACFLISSTDTLEFAMLPEICPIPRYVSVVSNQRHHIHCYHVDARCLLFGRRRRVRLLSTEPFAGSVGEKSGRLHNRIDAHTLNIETTHICKSILIATNIVQELHCCACVHIKPFGAAHRTCHSDLGSMVR